jgi:hypothetical protein
MKNLRLWLLGLVSLMIVPSCVPMSIADVFQEQELEHLSWRILAIEIHTVAATDQGAALLEDRGVDISLPLSSVKPDGSLRVVRVVLIPSQSEWGGLLRVLTSTGNSPQGMIEAIEGTNLVRFGEMAESGNLLHFRRVPDGDYDLIGVWANTDPSTGMMGRRSYNWAPIKVANGDWDIQAMVGAKRSEIVRPVGTHLQ